MLLDSVNVDTKRTQTKNKTVGKYSNDKIQFTFFCLPYRRRVNFLRGVFLQYNFIQIHTKEKVCKLGSANLNRSVEKVGRVTGNRGTFFRSKHAHQLTLNYITSVDISMCLEKDFCCEKAWKKAFIY